MGRKKEERVIRRMRVIRSWLPQEEAFKYFTIYSDGTVEPATRREAEQYATAYGKHVQTIVGEPDKNTWNITTS